VEAPVTAVLLEPALREPSRLGQRGVQGERGVALREDESIAIGMTKAGYVEDPAIERGHHVGDREATPDMTDVGALRLVNDRPPDVKSHPRKVRHPARILFVGLAHGVPGLDNHTRSHSKRPGEERPVGW
jgi:hypothetical protein